QKIHVLYLILLILISSCERKKGSTVSVGNNEVLEIPLDPSISGNFRFDPIRYTDFPVYTLKKSYPELYKKRMSSFKGIPELDSLMLVSASMQMTPHYYELYRYGYFNKGEFLKRARN